MQRPVRKQSPSSLHPCAPRNRAQGSRGLGPLQRPTAGIARPSAARDLADMRIALIDPSLFTWPYDATLALALQARGHEVAIFGKPIDAAEAGPAYPLLRPHFYRLLDTPLAKRLPHAAFLGVKGVLHIAEMRRLLAELREF